MQLWLAKMTTIALMRQRHRVVCVLGGPWMLVVALRHCFPNHCDERERFDSSETKIVSSLSEAFSPWMRPGDTLHYFSSSKINIFQKSNKNWKLNKMAEGHRCAYYFWGPREMSGINSSFTFIYDSKWEKNDYFHVLFNHLLWKNCTILTRRSLAIFPLSLKTKKKKVKNTFRLLACFLASRLLPGSRMQDGRIVPFFDSCLWRGNYAKQ